MVHHIFDPATAATMSAGLAGLIATDDGPSDEQQRMFIAFSRHFLLVEPPPASTAEAPAPETLAEELSGPASRRRFVQMAVVLELCRHPASDRQVALVGDYGSALGVGGDELESVRAQVHENAAAATDDFIRRFDRYVVELSEFEFTHPEQGRSDEQLWNEVHTLDRHPPGTLGSEYIGFHRRNGFDLPGPTTPSPAYYVSHDMNHVITGYEPTGPGEIALGAFKLSMNDSEANWMASMANVLIHEAGLIKHGTSAQFVPFGGAPYPGPDGQFGALSLPGAADLVAESFARGAACTSDFSRADHLSLAHLPLAEVRERYQVTRPARLMRTDEIPGLWP